MSEPAESPSPNREIEAFNCTPKLPEDAWVNEAISIVHWTDAEGRRFQTRFVLYGDVSLVMGMLMRELDKFREISKKVGT